MLGLGDAICQIIIIILVTSSAAEGAPVPCRTARAIIPFNSTILRQGHASERQLAPRNHSGLESLSHPTKGTPPRRSEIGHVTVPAARTRSSPVEISHKTVLPSFLFGSAHEQQRADKGWSNDMTSTLVVGSVKDKRSSRSFPHRYLSAGFVPEPTPGE